MFVCFTHVHTITHNSLTIQSTLQDMLSGHLASAITNFVQFQLTITKLRDIKVHKNWTRTWKVFAEPVTYYTQLCLVPYLLCATTFATRVSDSALTLSCMHTSYNLAAVI